MNLVQSLSRYYFTIKPLKCIQYYSLLRHRFFRIKRVKTFENYSTNTWSQPFVYFSSKPLALVDKWTFTFLGEQYKIGDDWNVKSASKLWLYNLHYHDDLNKEDSRIDAELYHDLILKWIKDNPPVTGNGWEPYPLSLRIVNWVKWLSRQDTIDDLVLSSLCSQVDALDKQIEYHLQANHLFENAKALVFFGAFIDSAQGKKSLEKGLKLLDQQIKEQFFYDGGHFEGSPMYHAEMIWNMCDLYLLGECSDLAVLKMRLSSWKAVIEKGMAFLRSMSHPDGEIAFFNDSAFGIAPSYNCLARYLGYLNISLESDMESVKCVYPFVKRYEQSGYIEVQISPHSKAVLDTANISPSYQPGHAHADTLSFELSLFGHRVFVNTGTSQYGKDPERHRQRSTMAHNTVVINGVNSSDVWGGFRVGRRALVNVEKCLSQQGEVNCIASHDGYKYLAGSLRHRRSWTFNTNSLSILDEIQGEKSEAEFRLYLHPSVSVKFLNKSLLQLDFDDKRAFFECYGNEVKLGDSTWHSEFGKSIGNKVISIIFEQNALKTNIRWAEN